MPSKVSGLSIDGGSSWNNDSTPKFNWSDATDASGIKSYWWSIDDSSPTPGWSSFNNTLGGESVTVDFMGEPARFPGGVYVLAAILRCPIYLLLTLHSATNRYDVYCEPFAQKIELPRQSREEVVVGYAQRFARRLEHYGRMAPDNWFNFYDFWETEP